VTPAILVPRIKKNEKKKEKKEGIFKDNNKKLK
jgi:hypothetical protein